MITDNNCLLVGLHRFMIWAKRILEENGPGLWYGPKGSWRQMGQVCDMGQRDLGGKWTGFVIWAKGILEANRPGMHMYTDYRPMFILNHSGPGDPLPYTRKTLRTIPHAKSLIGPTHGPNIPFLYLWHQGRWAYYFTFNVILTFSLGGQLWSTLNG